MQTFKNQATNLSFQILLKYHNCALLSFQCLVFAQKSIDIFVYVYEVRVNQVHMSNKWYIVGVNPVHQGFIPALCYSKRDSK